MSYNTMSTSFNAGGGYCLHCSHSPYSFVYHSGLCPQVKAQEYQNGQLTRIEFHKQDVRFAGLHQGQIKVSADFDEPMDFIRAQDAYQKARVAIVEEKITLEPGRYIIIDGELFKLEDALPPWAESKDE